MINKKTLALGMIALAIPTAAFMTLGTFTMTGESYGASVQTPLVTLLKAPYVTVTSTGMNSDDLLTTVVPGVLNLGTINTMTSGGGEAENGSVQSSTSASNINILAGVVTADALMAFATSTFPDLSTAESSAEGSDFVNLKVLGQTVGPDVSPNTTIQLPGTGRVILNEQIPSGDGVTTTGMTVNMIHVVLTNPLTGATTGNIIVGSASSNLTR